MRIYVFVFICAWSLVSLGQDQAEKARAQYLNKEVTVTGSVFRVAAEEGGRYKVSAGSPWISETYKGQTATVIAVQERDIPPLSTAKVNALGERIDPRPPDDLEFVVKFQDGLIALKSDSALGIRTWLLLPEDVAARKAAQDEGDAKAKRLIGKNVFATALSKVYRGDASLAEMSDDRARVSPPQLVPLQIVAAKWNPDVSCAIVKLQLPDSTYAISMVWPEPRQSAGLQDDIDCNRAQLLSSIPFFLTADEIRAIQRRIIMRGISTLAVSYSVGLPDRESDSGRNGKQLIYRTGLYVYTDPDGKVIDWQQAGTR